MLTASRERCGRYRALPVDSSRFRDGLGRFASGVTVVTTRHEDNDYGATVSAFSSVSLEPPLVLCCFRTGSQTVRAILECGRFAVSLLQDLQEAVARQFASAVPDRFAGVRVNRADDGLPLIDGALAQLVCTVASHAQAGDHTVVFGAVERLQTQDGMPLVAFRGSLGSFQKP